MHIPDDNIVNVEIPSNVVPNDDEAVIEQVGIKILDGGIQIKQQQDEIFERELTNHINNRLQQDSVKGQLQKEPMLAVSQ